jgi:cyclic-di-GMP phosphodiesterase TipF (flagellum assembly factor)
MGRLSAFFVAICMVLIACSIGAVLYLRFGLSGAESALIALTALTALALVNAVSARLNDRRSVDAQVQELARGSAELSRHVAELGRRVAAIDGNAQAAVETTLAATQPISEEIGEVGGLIKQIAEAVAAHDTQLKGLSPSATPSLPIPEARVVPIATIPSLHQNPSLNPHLNQNPNPDSASDVIAAPADTASPDLPPEPPSAELSSEVAAAGSLETQPKQAEPAFVPPPVSDPLSAELKPVEAMPAVPASNRIGVGRFKDMQPAAVIEMIRDAVDNNRIDLFLQPIVTLPQRKVRYYEAVARLRASDGEQLAATDFLPYAEAGGLMPQIDNMMLFRCVQVVRRLLAKNREIGVFCNISASTLVDSTFPQFTEFLEANKAIAPALVFEFTQAALRSMGSPETESLATLAERGYRFSLDNVTDLRIEPRDLAERGFRFVKVQGSLLLNRTAMATSDIHAQDFAGLLSRFGVELIAAKIESEAAVVDLLDYDVKFGQGVLFSPPRPVRPEVMQGIGDRNDMVSGDAPPATAPAAAAPVVGTRLTSLTQLARGAIARN